MRRVMPIMRLYCPNGSDAETMEHFFNKLGQLRLFLKQKTCFSGNNFNFLNNIQNFDCTRKTHQTTDFQNKKLQNCGHTGLGSLQGTHEAQ
jgi:hypothetical protein